MYVGEKRKRRDDIVLLFTAYTMNGNQEKSLGLAYSVEKKKRKGREKRVNCLFICLPFTSTCCRPIFGQYTI